MELKLRKSHMTLPVLTSFAVETASAVCSWLSIGVIVVG